MKLFGALLVILSGSLFGLSAYGRLRDFYRETKRSMHVLERLHAEICLRRSSLPEAVKRIRGRSSESSDPFSAWTELLLSLRLTGARYEIMEDLGERLRAGDEPERAFSLCREDMKLCAKEAEDELHQKGKLYAVLGVSAGLLTAIVLI